MTIDRNVDLLLKRSQMRVNVSCSICDNMTRCLERSMRAIVQSRLLLANSESLVPPPESSEADNPQLTSPIAECLTTTERLTTDPTTNLLPVVSKRDFGYEPVSIDGRHFCDCSFWNCTLLYSGNPVTFESCRFHGCNFDFSGAAGRTVQFLDCFGMLSHQATEQFEEATNSELTLVN